MRRIYKPGIRYAKAGVYLSELAPKGSRSQDLFTQQASATASKSMAVLDRVNRLFGRGTLKPARLAQENPAWTPRREKLSPNYTTQWGAFLTVRA